MLRASHSREAVSAVSLKEAVHGCLLLLRSHPVVQGHLRSPTPAAGGSALHLTWGAEPDAFPSLPWALPGKAFLHEAEYLPRDRWRPPGPTEPRGGALPHRLLMSRHPAGTHEHWALLLSGQPGVQRQWPQ